MDGFQAYVEQYGEYLEDIRKRVFQIFVFFGIIFLIGFFATTPLVRVMTEFLRIKQASLVATSPFQLVDLAMDVGIFFGIVLTSPLLVYHLYSFLKPGLFDRERRLFLILIPVASLLFVLGFFYGLAIMYYALHIIAVLNVSIGVVNLWDISLFMSQMILTSTILGLLFEYPVVMTFLIRANVLSVAFLRSKRRHAFIVICMFVALLPPNDILSLTLMSLPLFAIYELTILFNRNTSQAVVPSVVYALPS